MTFPPKTKDKGVEKNPAEAVKWYRMAAEQGNAGAQFNLGRCYANGEGVQPNTQEAVEWFLKAYVNPKASLDLQERIKANLNNLGKKPIKQ